MGLRAFYFIIGHTYFASMQLLFTFLCFITGRSHSRHADGHTPVRRAKAVPRDSIDEQLGENASDHVKNVIRSSMQVRLESG